LCISGQDLRTQTGIVTVGRDFSPRCACRGIFMLLLVLVMVVVMMMMVVILLILLEGGMVVVKLPHLG
jgi:hypothetical protein